jgi:hypothetical protein
MKSMKTLIRVSVALGVMAAGLTMSSTAFAQQGVINLEESVIKGRIQKPEAFYILQPANLDYEALDAQPSFIDALLETVEEEPF